MFGVGFSPTFFFYILILSNSVVISMLIFWVLKYQIKFIQIVYSPYIERAIGDILSGKLFWSWLANRHIAV